MTREATPVSAIRERLGQLRVRDFFNLRMLGFALARAWTYLMFLGISTSSITWTGVAPPPFVFIGSTIALCATLFTGAVLHRSSARLITDPLLRFVGPLLTCLGTLCIIFAGATEPEQSSQMSTPVLSWANVLFMIGAASTGIGSALLMLGFGELYRTVEPLKTGFETPFAFLIAALCSFIISAVPIALACVICTCLPLTSGLLLIQQLAQKASDTPQSLHEVHLGKFSWKIGLCACLVGLADGVVRATFLFNSAVSVGDFYRFPLVLAALLGFVIIGSCLSLEREGGLRSVYKAVMLVMAVFFMLLPVFTGFLLVESAIALAGYGTFNALIWIILAEMSYTFRLSSMMVFGIGWGMVSFGVFLGSSVGQMLLTLAPFSPQILSLIALLATATILVSYMFVFRERDLMGLIKPDKKEEAAPQLHRFYERCRRIAEKHQLSPKETEIMVLYAKGRSSVHIQKELFISRGTCTTHLRHIYQKLGVHDKQEFLDMIENYRPEV
ncbi:MAG: helix-turn-helix domain-containing protein [Coriobacteriales bacterium]|jgi:DNA-binding CsgD family transcriptional regulator|nr:helix-turn-helix domain-containing protein [Coriobacteriales bacterium]